MAVMGLDRQMWEIIAGVSETPGAKGFPVFGVRVTLPDGSRWEWPDVDVRREVAERLARRLQRVQPERCHFTELVLDFIQEVAGAPE